MKILSMAKGLENNFTKSEEKLYKIVVNDPQIIVDSTITQLSEFSSTSDSTIIRFCRKFKYDGFHDFKLALAQELSALKAEEKEEILSGPIENDDSIETISKKFYAININALQQTMDIMDYRKISECAKMILQARKIHFIGIGYSGTMAQDIKYKFMRIGMDTDAYTDADTMIMMCSIMNKDDLVFAISHSGSTSEIVKSLKVAKESGAKTISISSSINSNITSYSDVSLHYASTETKFQTGSLPTKIAQSFVIDLIYTEVVRNSVDKAFFKIRTTKALDNLMSGQ